MKPANSDRLRQQLAETIVTAMLPYIGGWVETLGKAGSPKNKTVAPATRVTAAKTGLDLVKTFMASGTSVGGEDLLRRLEELRNNPQPPLLEDDEDTDPNGTTGGDWTKDTELGDEEPDLEPDLGPDS